jgi:hypothetical protein
MHRRWDPLGEFVPHRPSNSTFVGLTPRQGTNLSSKNDIRTIYKCLFADFNAICEEDV